MTIAQSSDHSKPLKCVLELFLFVCSSEITLHCERLERFHPLELRAELSQTNKSSSQIS